MSGPTEKQPSDVSTETIGPGHPPPDDLPEILVIVGGNGETQRPYRETAPPEDVAEVEAPPRRRRYRKAYCRMFYGGFPQEFLESFYGKQDPPIIDAEGVEADPDTGED